MRQNTKYEVRSTSTAATLLTELRGEIHERICELSLYPSKISTSDDVSDRETYLSIHFIETLGVKFDIKGVSTIQRP